MGADIHFHAIEPDTELDVGGFTVRAFHQNHPGGSFGYRFRRDGKTVVYSSDAEHKKDSEDPDFPYLDIIRDADLLIFDAQFDQFIQDTRDYLRIFSESPQLQADIAYDGLCVDVA